MRVASAVLAVLLLAGCASGGGGRDGADGGPPAAAGRGSLAGLVVDEALRPLGGARVAAHGPAGSAEALTGADGLFRLDGLAEGSYAVEASKPTYLSAHALAQVVAGVADPPLVQLALQVQADELPFAKAVVWDGYIGCAFSYGNLCSAPAQGGFDVIGDQSAHLFWSEYVDAQRVPDLVQAEAVWEATLATSEELQPIFGWSTPDEWAVFQYGGTFASFSTPSPMLHRLTAEELGEVGLGVEVGLVVEFYSGDPGGVPAGLTLNQPIRLVLHNFYGYLPPDGWTFVADGAPPGPA